jgi:hypothetical protein
LRQDVQVLFQYRIALIGRPYSRRGKSRQRARAGHDDEPRFVIRIALCGPIRSMADAAGAVIGLQA